MGFLELRQARGVNSPPRDLPDPGIETASLVSPALAAGFFATVPPRKPPCISWKYLTHHPLKLHQS